jgi:hypothetical protein
MTKSTRFLVQIGLYLTCIYTHLLTVVTAPVVTTLVATTLTIVTTLNRVHAAARVGCFSRECVSTPRLRVGPQNNGSSSVQRFNRGNGSQTSQMN